MGKSKKDFKLNWNLRNAGSQTVARASRLGSGTNEPNHTGSLAPEGPSLNPRNSSGVKRRPLPAFRSNLLSVTHSNTDKQTRFVCWQNTAACQEKQNSFFSVQGEGIQCAPRFSAHFQFGYKFKFLFSFPGHPALKHHRFFSEKKRKYTNHTNLDKESSRQFHWKSEKKQKRSEINYRLINRR